MARRFDGAETILRAWAAGGRARAEQACAENPALKRSTSAARWGLLRAAAGALPTGAQRRRRAARLSQVQTKPTALITYILPSTCLALASTVQKVQ